MLIFGSTALKHWFPDFSRTPRDLDIIGSGTNSKGVEYHFNPGFQYILDNNIDSKYVDPNFLYTIKMSHAGWDIRWDKTMMDIQFLKSKGCEVDLTLFNLLLNDWNKIHYNKKVKLTGTTENFFNSNITRKLNHDELHHFVKFNDNPMHERIRPDKESVNVSKSLWDSLSFDDKFKCALEEAYVFALERYSDYPPKISLYKALKQLITKSTKGYFNYFLIDNFMELWNNDLTNFKCKYNKYRELYG